MSLTQGPRRRPTRRPKPRTHSEGLAPALRRLVKVVEAALGDVITNVEGRTLYDTVEAVRLDMVAVREGDPAALTRARKRIRRVSPAERAALARAYTVYLELVNVCENAYRTHRLRERARAAEPGTRSTDPANVVFVLTAHPTESRSPANIALMRRIQALLVEGLERRDLPDDARLTHLLHLVWTTGTHPAHRPTVEDEALHLFSLLDDPILEELLDLRREGHRVRIRTWVGGDKDGHPGVGPEETEKSLNLSRRRLLELVEGRLLREVQIDVPRLADAGVDRAWDHLRDRIETLRTVTTGDGRQLRLLQRAVSRLADEYADRLGHTHPRLGDLRLLLEQFPGLVVPIELREQAGLFQRHGPIADMLRLLHDVARGGRVDWYVRAAHV